MKKLYSMLILFYLVYAPLCAQWEIPANTGLPTFQFSPIMTAGGSYLFVDGKYRSSNHGDSWEEYNYAIDQFNKPTAQFYYDGKLFSGHNTSGDCIHYSTDNGTTWQIPQGIPRTTKVYGFFQHNGIMFAYVPGTVYKSTDGGLNWAPKGSSLGVIVAMTSLGNDLYLTSTTQGVYKSSDNGETWVQSNNGILNSFPFNDWPGKEIWSIDGKIYFFSASGAFYISSDGAANWEKWTQTLIPGGSIALRSVYRNGNHFYYKLAVFNFTSLKWEEKILLTDDEGVTLTDITADLPITGTGEKIIEFDNYVYVAYTGSQDKFYRRNLSSLTTGVEDTEEIPVKFELMQNYPNPFNPSTKISFSLPQSSFVNLSVYDITGREVVNLIKQQMNAGAYAVNFNAANLSSGIYLYKISAGAFLQTKKMILIK